MSEKFTFKKHPKATGLAGVGCPYPDTEIKLGGKFVGTIHAPNWKTKDDMWKIGLIVDKEASEDDPCEWKWIIFKHRHATEEEARQWLKKNETSIKEKYKLHPIDR